MLNMFAVGDPTDTILGAIGKLGDDCDAAYALVKPDALKMYLAGILRDHSSRRDACEISVQYLPVPLPFLIVTRMSQ